MKSSLKVAAEGNIISLLCGPIVRNITSVQLNIATNTVHFNYAKLGMLCYLCFLEEFWVLEWIQIRFGHVCEYSFVLVTSIGKQTIFLSSMIFFGGVGGSIQINEVNKISLYFKMNKWIMLTIKGDDTKHPGVSRYSSPSIGLQRHEIHCTILLKCPTSLLSFP